MNDSAPLLKEIFAKALDCTSQAERDRYLAQACGGDRELRAEVESLLMAHEDAGSFLELTAADKSIAERPGAIIGHYKLLEQIGEGGFGVVFMAEQSEPMRRKVALKILKPGMDTRQVVARFEAERQALAIMDHVNIARVLDGGATATGRPYFVMELVRGVPITDFCDQNHLNVRERLELFVDVCQAVQHAHQKGIIHRDIKPTNVMVTLNDGKPVVKVIDFGIAKALGQQLTEKTLFTNFAQMIGTPLYMSPEQAQMSAVDVDTRSDIYSLGVLLYELLTGTTPFDKERLETAAYDEIRRIIREEEPAKPSTRLSTLGQAAATVSANRNSNAKQLSQLCRGELDWIVMKALEKDRGRRYETANSFALDVRRYLADEPVQACPPSATYRLRKVMWRNRATMTAAALVFLAMAVGTAISIWQGVEATLAKADALKNEKDALKAADAEKAARQDAMDKLRDAYLAQAQARRWSGQAGRRFTSLDVLGQAAEIRAGLDLRIEAVACMPLVDMRIHRKLLHGWVALDGNLERHARVDADGNLNIYRVADDTKLATLRIDGEACVGGTFSPDSKLILAAYGALHIRIWDIETGKVLLKLERTAGTMPWSWAFSPDGRRYAFSSGEGSLRTYELPSGKELHRFNVTKGGAHIDFHPFEAKLAWHTYDPGDANNQIVRILDDSTGAVLTQWASGGDIHSLAWHPAGRYLAVGGGRSVRIWDARTKKTHKTLEGHQNEVRAVAYNHAGDLLVSSGWDVTTRLWDPISGKQLVSMPGYFAGFSRDDRRLAYHFADVSRENGIWEIATGSECRTMYADTADGSGLCSSVDFHRDGRLLATSGGDGVRIWDLAAHQELHRLPVGSSRTALFDPEGKSLITYGQLGIQRWPILVDREVSRLRIGPPQTISPPLAVHTGHTRARLSQNGRWLAAVGPKGAVVFDLHETIDPVRFEGHAGVWGVAISPDGRWVVTVTQHGKDIKVWDRHGLAPVRTLPGANYGVASFSPDGKWLFTSSIGHEPQQWHVESWTPRPLGKEFGGLLYMASNGDRNMLALAYDGAPATRQLALVNATTNELVTTLTAPQPLPVSDLCFSPDGSRLAVSCADQNAVQLWDLRALRKGLVDLNLAGDWPAYAPLNQPANPPPLEVQVLDAGHPGREAKSDKD